AVVAFLARIELPIAAQRLGRQVRHGAARRARAARAARTTARIAAVAVPAGLRRAGEGHHQDARATRDASHPANVAPPAARIDGPFRAISRDAPRTVVAPSWSRLAPPSASAPLDRLVAAR